MSGPNLFFFAAVAIPQSEKHRSDGAEAAGKNNGRLMWIAEETAGSKDLRSVYGPLPGPDRPQICGRRNHRCTIAAWTTLLLSLIVKMIVINFFIS